MRIPTALPWLLLPLLPPARAGFKILCDYNVQERIDPILSPTGPSAHVHVLTGAGGVNFTSASTSFNTLQQAPCTSCLVKEDKSVYWVPQLYYQGQDGRFTAVPIAGSDAGQRGGITIYYQQRGPGNGDPAAGVNYTAFPPGFRMIAGDPFKRSAGSDFASQAVSWLCLGVNGTSASQSFAGLPNVTCSGGMRAQLNFPHCWNGKDLDPPDHKSHMSYALPGTVNGTTGGPDGGVCPSAFPVYTMQLFYEIVFNTGAFAWWNGSNPFVLAQGDPTGYGYHGDFVTGWSPPVLQTAANTCNNGNAGDAAACRNFTIASFDEQLECTIAPQIAEDVLGPMAALLGCNPVQPGPARATAPASCSRTGVVGPAKTYYTDQTKTAGYGYIGCGNDTASNRTFTNYWTPPGMTVDACIAHCNQGGWLYAGLEYTSDCYCGNTTYADRLPQPGILGNCDMACKGNSSQYCGGFNAISFYKRCAQNGTSCVNRPSA